MAKISVAMTTYNGSNYIIKQLDSLKNQSRKLTSSLFATTALLIIAEKSVMSTGTVMIMSV